MDKDLSQELQAESTKTKKEKAKSRIPIVKMDGLTHCLSTRGSKEDCFHVGPIHLDIFDGEIFAVVGPSGSGKTTFLRLLAGLEKGKEGSLSIDGRPVFNDSTFIPAEKRKVGMVFQEHGLFPHLTVRNNILFGIRNWNKDDRDRRLFELEKLLGLQNCLNRYPSQLSGGQQQRVALARTLAPNPKVVLLDEPLSNIDAELRASLAQELRHVLQKAATTAIWVTHDQSEALDLADRIAVMNKGKIEQIDTPWNLYYQPKTRFVADFIGHAVFIKGDAKGDMILTEIGTVPCVPCLRKERSFEIMLRPDDVKAKPHDAGLGTVVKRQFLGPIQTYTVHLPSGQEIMTNQPAHINWPVGTKVQVSLDLKTVVAFPVH